MYVCLCVVVASSRFLFFKKLKNFGNRRFIPEGYIKMMAGRAKKNHTHFRHLTVTTSWGFHGVQKYNMTENMVYSPGSAQKYLFSKHVVINAHRTNILENKFLGPSTYPHVQFSKKVKTIVQYVEKTREFSIFFFCVTSAKKLSATFLKFRNTSFCS